MSRRHRLRTTTVLLALGAALVVCCGGLGGLIGLVTGLGAAALLVTGAYAASGRLALRAMRAYPVGEAEQPRLCGIVRELATVLRQPMPAVYVSPVAAPNAFAAGRSPRRAAICVTEGLLRRLDERELRAVVGHELAHVANRDIIVTSVASAVAAMLLTFAQCAWRLPGRRRAARHPLGLVLLLAVAPITALVVRLVIHRSREFEADLVAARITGDPLALAGALRAVERGTRAAPLPAEPRLRASASLMIADPFAGGGLSWLFSTHPATAERIRRLERLAGR